MQQIEPVNADHRRLSAAAAASAGKFNLISSPVAFHRAIDCLLNLDRGEKIAS
jgi:hypothetical protein